MMNPSSPLPTRDVIAKLVSKVTSLCQSESFCPPLRIVGIGSENGADSLGLRVAELLKTGTCSKLPTDAAVFSLTAPHRLLDILDGDGTLIVVDALGYTPRSEADAFIWRDARIQLQSSHSSHSFGVSETLELADQLGLLPSRVLLVGI